MNELGPTSGVDRRNRGLALADALLAKSRELPPLSRAAHQRVQRRLRASLLPRAGRRRSWLRPVVVALVLLSSGAAFGIALNRLMSEPPPSSPAPDAPAAADDGRAAYRGRVRKNRDSRRDQFQASLLDPPVTALPEQAAHEIGESKPVAVPQAEEASGMPERSPKAPKPLRLAFRSASAGRTASLSSVPADRDESADGVAWRARPVESAPAADASAPTEEELLATAVRALRVGRDPLPALAALDAYRARHPDGRLSIEANVLRAEALTALGRKSEALRGLDAIDLGRVPGAAERRLERGELREGGGEPAKALADFDWVLAHTQQPALIEAALAGRMRCRQRLGDLAGATGDAAEYLRRFPAAPSASEAMGIAGAGRKTASP